MAPRVFSDARVGAARQTLPTPHDILLYFKQYFHFPELSSLLRR